MKLKFYKYQGTGNDFVIIDNRKKDFPDQNTSLIKKLCDRKFGIGADGLMLLENSDGYDFKMIYYNADGKEGSMCGNGGRCIVAFARKKKIIGNDTSFEAVDGVHHASIKNHIVSLEMGDIDTIEDHKNYIFLDTGSPHHVQFSDDISEIDIYRTGNKIRYGAPYFEKGTNVNFVEQTGQNSFKVRTYERGVENETLSCGTGVTAVAIAADYLKKSENSTIKLQTLGGDLEVSFKKNQNKYRKVFLKGPATFVFKGKIII